jgi:hypothetical protein
LTYAVLLQGWQQQLQGRQQLLHRVLGLHLVPVVHP